MRAIPAGNKTELVGYYVGEKCGCAFTPGQFEALAILNEADEFVAGVVVSRFSGHDCEISCATETSAAWRDTVMRGVFDYVFNQLGCVRCTSITKKGNRKARGFLEGLGFQLEGNLRLGFDGVKDALIYGYLKSECKYLEPLKDQSDGQEHSESPDAPGPLRDGASAGADEQRDGDIERVPKPN